MSRAALRKPQHNLFAAGPAAALASQPIQRRPDLFLHPCEAPGCEAWGAFGVGAFRGVRGTWWCGEHRPTETSS